MAFGHFICNKSAVSKSIFNLGEVKHKSFITCRNEIFSCRVNFYTSGSSRQLYHGYGICIQCCSQLNNSKFINTFDRCSGQFIKIDNINVVIVIN